MFQGHTLASPNAESLLMSACLTLPPPSDLPELIKETLGPG